jgi:hypothetical protein
MSEHDFMPIDGWDHLEMWVGNAKQSAFFYENAYGFTRTAYAGPETGVRDRASYVLEQGEIRFVLTNILWFHSLHLIGPARATLAANLQPFVAAVLAVILLSESLHALELVGAAVIGVGVLMARRAPVPA